MNLKRLRIIPFLAAMLFLPFLSNGQCQWRLELKDSGGDGWDGSFLIVTNGPNFNFYTLDGFADNGTNASFLFDVTVGDDILLEWFDNALNPEEISVTLYNGDGNIVFESTAPEDGEIFNTTITCPSCILPQNVFEENIYDKRVKIRWTPGVNTASPIGWWVIYGPDGLVPALGVGDTLYVTTPKVTITGLLPKTPYTYYIIQDCGNGDYSGLSGPHNFTTYWSNDVAVTAVISPVSDCELQAEVIEFAMSNPGSNPQSLIPYNFNVNGQPGGVGQPDDGFYTGVIGKDSTEIIEFETSYNFSDKIEYEIMVFTQMEGDEDNTNDTLYYYINNVLAPPYAQSFEKWNGGWTTMTDPDSFSPSSWAYGVPNAPIIKAAGDGQKAWVTNLTGNVNFAENSYIQSTCFDFSDITEKPALEFLINYSSNEGSEGSFVEYSIDGGANWVRIGTSANTGANWYNAPDPTTGEPNRAWSGQSNTWLKAHHLVNGVAGEENVLFRFGFTSGFGENGEGVGIDQFKVFVPASLDLSAIKGTTLGENEDCGLAADKFTLNIVNVGGGAIPSGYKLFYSVNGGTPDSVTVTNNILTPDENYTFTFPNTFDSRDAVTVIRAWVVAANDQNLFNDTLVYTVDHRAQQLPFSEDFEASQDIPDGWSVTSGAFVTNAHNNETNVLAFNLYSSFNTFTFDLPRHGLVGVGDSIKFDYRIVDYSFPNPATTLETGNKIDIKISDNCGQTFQTLGTINALNHTPSEDLQTRKYSLGAYVGENIKVQFVGTWASGDFWFDLDNVNILSCAGDMGLQADIVPASGAGNNGSATVTVGNGNPPYQYNWSNGATTASVSGLGAGIYQVSVLDAHGCSDTLEVEVLTSSVGELPGLTNFLVRPNPTSGTLFLDVQFTESVDLQADVVNLLGQQIWSSNAGNTTGVREMIDLGQQPAGIYLLRITANGTVQTRKIVLTK